MENSSNKSGGVEIPKRKRSLDLKSLYKSRVSEVGESKGKNSEKNHGKDVEKKKKKSRKEVTLSSIKSDDKRSKEEDVNGEKLVMVSDEKSSGGNKGLHGIKAALGDFTVAFNIPKRPRGHVGRKRQKIDQLIGPLGFADSNDHSGPVDVGVTKSENNCGPSHKSVNVVAISAGNDVISKLKSRDSLGRENLENDKHSRLSVLPHSVDRVGPADIEVTKSKADGAGPNDRLADVAADSESTGAVSKLNSVGKSSRSKSKSKRKPDSKATFSTSSSSQNLKRKAGADEVKENGNVGSGSAVREENPCVKNGNRPSKKSRSNIVEDKDVVVDRHGKDVVVDRHGKDVVDRDGKDVVDKDEDDVVLDRNGKDVAVYRNGKDVVVGRVGDEALRKKMKPSACKVKESRSARPGTIEKEENLAVNDELNSSKKRRSHSRKKKELLVGEDVGEASTKKSEPSLGGSVSDSLFVDFLDDDDEENLEQNAARMLSSRFDPSCTGFSAKKNTSITQTADGVSFPVSSARDHIGQQVNSSGGTESVSADDKSIALRQKEEDKGNHMPRRRRHFYEIAPSDLDASSIVNRRIKIFWPLDESWYHGFVNDYHPEIKLYHIKYDDRDEEWVDLQEEKFKLLLLPSEVPRKANSRKRKTRSKEVHEVKTVQKSDDDSSAGNNFDSEPIASWLVRSTQRVKSSKKQNVSQMHPPAVLSLSSSRTENSHGHSNMSEAHTSRDKQDCESTLVNNLTVDGRDDKVLPRTSSSSKNRTLLVYARKKYKKNIKSYSSAPTDVDACQIVTPIGPVMVGSPSAEEDKSYCERVDFVNQFWFIDDRGKLKFNVVLVASADFTLEISLALFPFLEFVHGIGDICLLHNLFMLQQGTLVTSSPAVQMEILLSDSTHGLKLLLFDGYLKQALAFIFQIFALFNQPDEQWRGDILVPVTWIRFQLFGVQDRRKHHVFAFHRYSGLQSSKWLHLESKLLQHCMLVKEVPVSEFICDIIKNLDSVNSEQSKKHRGVELSEYKLLMDYSFAQINLQHHDAMCSAERSENVSLPAGETEAHLNSASVNVEDIAVETLETENPDFRARSSSEQDSATDAVLISNAIKKVGSSPDLQRGDRDGAGSENAPEINPQQKQIESIKDVDEQSHVSSLPDAPTLVDPTSNPRCDSKSDGLIVDVPSFDQVDLGYDSKGYVSSQPDVGWKVKDGFADSPKIKGSRSELKYASISSLSSPLGDLSPVWHDGKTNSVSSRFTKKPRTQVQYTLPLSGFDLNGKQKMQNQRNLPCKRIRKASVKRTSDGHRNNQKNLDLLVCNGNVLVTQGDKGWRVCGAHTVLEVADHNEWKLAVKLSGITKYSYKVKHVFQPGSTNRFTHAMMWKGGKDWVLEFPDRSQWMLFKELHEECYNRNIRAASVKNIPIPGVRLIEENDDDGTDIPYIRNSAMYFRQVQTDVEMAMDPSRVLYDMDSDDEQWFSVNMECVDEELSEELLEKTIDMFEKVSYIQKRDTFTDAEIEEVAVGIGSVKAAKLIYEHWRQKREKKGMPLIRHLQPPLWERYQQQLKEWEQTFGRGNGPSTGSQEKVEKPPMFAFCLKPRGLDVPSRGSKQRSNRKYLVSGHHHAGSGDPDGLLGFGRRSNGHPFGDEKMMYHSSFHEHSDVSPSLRASTRVLSPSDAHFSLGTDASEWYRKPNKNKIRKLGSLPSSNNQHSTYNQRTKMLPNQNAGQQRNAGLPETSSQPRHYSEGHHRQGVEQLDSAVLEQYRLCNAAGEARAAREIAKRKRARAQRLLHEADEKIQKAAFFVMNAEAVKAALENSGNES